MGRSRRKPLPPEVQADRALCSVEVAGALGLKVRIVASAMRAAGVSATLTLEEAKRWRNGGGQDMPDWLTTLYAERAAVSAQKAHAAEIRRLEDEHKELLREERIHSQLASGRRRFSEADMWIVEQVAFDAAKDLVRGSAPDELSPVEVNALRACRIDPEQHHTWPIHHGQCDGEGGPDCNTRMLAMEEERQAEKQAERFERQLASMHAEGRINSGEFTVGQPVLTYYDSRIGTVIKVNRVTLKVRFIGGHRDGYAIVEKNLPPEYLRPVPAHIPPAPAAASEVWIKDWRNESRIYGGIVVGHDRDLFEVQYTIKSGETRVAWFDRLRLTEVTG